MVEFLGFFASSSNQCYLGTDLLRSCFVVDLLKNNLGFLEFTMVDELSRALGAKWEEAPKEN